MNGHVMVDQREDWTGGWIQSCSCNPDRYLTAAEWAQLHGGKPTLLEAEAELANRILNDDTFLQPDADGTQRHDQEHPISLSVLGVKRYQEGGEG